MEKSLRLESRYRKGLKHSLIKRVRGKGLFLAVQLSEQVDVTSFISQAYQQGLIIDRFLFSEDSFRIAPPLIITEEEVDLSMERILGALDGMMK
jgi:acetylornithine/succinyldiaminopimelate/putrescine aminotransferase